MDSPGHNQGSPGRSLTTLCASLSSRSPTNFECRTHLPRSTRGIQSGQPRLASARLLSSSSLRLVRHPTVAIVFPQLGKRALMCKSHPLHGEVELPPTLRILKCNFTPCHARRRDLACGFREVGAARRVFFIATLYYPHPKTSPSTDGVRGNAGSVRT